MAFDAETYPTAPAADSSRDILSPAILAALPADKAQALYGLAAQVDHPKVWKLAAHALAGSLARLLATAGDAPQPCGPISPAQPSSAVSPDRKSRAQSAPRHAAGANLGQDLAAPLAAPPRNKTAVGDFHALWADGSVTRVTGVIYHTAKPATRWAAAFQAADRLRRQRARDAHAADLARTGAVTRHVRGACGIYQDSPEWMRLTALRPMPALVAIGETDGEVYDAPTGSTYGAGDAAAALAIEAALTTPLNPIGRSAPARIGLKRSVEINAAPDFYDDPPTPAVDPATGHAIEPCDAVSLWDLDGQLVVIDAARVLEDRSPASLERLKSVVHAAHSAVKAADNEADMATATTALETAKAAVALGHRIAGAAGDLLAHAGQRGERVLYTLRRGIAGKTFDLEDSTGKRILFGADLVPYLATARASQSLQMAA